jgi:hypothetical protein
MENKKLPGRSHITGWGTENQQVERIVTTEELLSFADECRREGFEAGAIEYWEHWNEQEEKTISFDPAKAYRQWLESLKERSE